MSAIKASNTTPEVYIRKILFSEGFRYRINQKNLPGKPDIVLAKYKTVVFVHGCFWHRHQCHLGGTPKSNVDFWDRKFDMNLNRDKRITQTLLNLGWKVIIIWECAIRGKFKQTEDLLRLKLSSSIRGNPQKFIEIEGCKI